MTQFKPTHELFDADGESRGLYRLDRGCYLDELVWAEGGRGVSAEELQRWQWRAVAFEPAPSASVTRARYESVCARVGVDASAFEACALQDWIDGKVARDARADYWVWLADLLTGRAAKLDEAK